jgi:hypothetical protein
MHQIDRPNKLGYGILTNKEPNIFLGVGILGIEIAIL